MSKPLRYLILTLLVLLPACYPFCTITDYASPFEPAPEVNDGTWIAFMVTLFFITVPPYWCFVGHLFARWVGSFWKSFFLGNIPIIFNAVGETVCYVVMGREVADIPLLAYFISSHIDKYPLVGIIFTHPLVGILSGTVAYLAFFTAGYGIRKHKLTDPLPPYGPAVK